MKIILSGVIRVVIIIVLLYGVWMWGFCRFYVPPDHMAVITSKSGKQLPPGQILAGPGEKGVREDVLGEGRHFLNPYLYEHQIMPITVIVTGKVGVVTSKVGTDLPAGEFLADKGQKGIWRSVLGPGKYRMNPYAYEIEVIDAISIPIGYVGVVTSLSGDRAPEGEFARGNQKGIREEILQPGLYYINPKQFKIDVLEIGVNQVSLLGKIGSEVITKGVINTSNEAMRELTANVIQEQQAKRDTYVQQQLSSITDSDQKLQLSRRMAPQAAESRAAARPSAPGRPSQAVSIEQAAPAFVLSQFVEFPSRDGFQISLDMTVEFELQPIDIARIRRDFGDLTIVVDNIIMPQVLSISRLKGSAYRATDFIVGEGREKFQTELTEALQATLKSRRIIVHNALIRHVQVPDQILDPIQQASIAAERDLTNKEKQNTAKKQAQLNTELSMIDQNRETVAQETAKLKAEIRAEQEKQVAEIQGQTLKQVATIEQQVAGVRAEKVKKLGQAEADVVRMVEGERAMGFQLKVGAFGNAEAYSLWEMAKAMNHNVKVNILHAGQGTLWTDLKNASMGDLGGAKVIQQAK